MSVSHVISLLDQVEVMLLNLNPNFSNKAVLKQLGVTSTAVDVLLVLHSELHYDGLVPAQKHPVTKRVTYHDDLLVGERFEL